ncbi:hypothetical protein M3Y97_00755100 [Aphelenchoides bicaudatus]|nr:hypothetical protein M3Y97_00755100 [Aphelenchoides bicaudatus]
MDQSMDVCLMSNNKNELNGNGTSGSCPDLSDEQLKLWDEILFKAVQNEREALDHKTEFITKNRRRTTNSVAPMHSELTNGKVNGITKRARSNTPAMQTSIYEICAPVEMEQTEEDENCDYNGNDVSKTSVCQKISIENGKSPESSSSKESSNSPPDNTPKEQQTETQKLAQKLRKELEDLQFRTSYEWQRSDGKVMKISTNPLFEDYPQPNNEEFYPTHMSNYDPKVQSFASTSIVKTNSIHPEECQFEADFFENMSIRVNPFEESVLEEEDCPQPSRFQQLQWAIQRQKERYNDSLQEPQRVCCNIM